MWWPTPPLHAQTSWRCSMDYTGVICNECHLMIHPDAFFKTFCIGKPRTWEKARKEKIPTSGQGRVQKVFWTQGAKVTQASFAPPKPSFAPVRNGVAPVQEAFRSLGPKGLLHPLLTTFGDCLFFGQFPSSVAPPPRFLSVCDVSKVRWLYSPTPWNALAAVVVL